MRLKILLCFAILAFCSCVFAENQQRAPYIADPNVFRVPAQYSTVQAAVAAAGAAQGGDITKHYIIEDYTGLPYTNAPGITVHEHVRAFQPASTVVRSNSSLTTTATPANMSAGAWNGLGSETGWPVVGTCSGLRWRFDNYSSYGKGYGNAIWIKASASVDGGTTWTALTFDGKPSKRVDWKAGVFSDQLNLTATKSAVPLVRCFAWVSSAGNLVPVNSRFSFAGASTCVADKFWSNDYSLEAKSSIADDGAVTLSFMPTAMYAVFAASPITIAAIGDSELTKTQTFGDLTTSALGMLARGRTDVAIHTLGYMGSPIELALDSELLDNMQGCKTVIVEFGINNVTDFANYWGGTNDTWLSDRLKPVWANLRQRGCKVYQTTILPYTAANGTLSTIPATFEGTATGGQSDYAAGGNVGAAIKAFNEALTGGSFASLIDGYIDWTSPLSKLVSGNTRRNWRFGMVDTTDPTHLSHPTSDGLQVMGNAIDAGIGRTVFGLTAPVGYVPYSCKASVDNQAIIQDNSGNSPVTPVVGGTLGTPAAVANYGGATRITRTIGYGVCELIGNATTPLVTVGTDFTILMWVNMSANPTGQILFSDKTLASSAANYNIACCMSTTTNGRLVTFYDQAFNELFSAVERDNATFNTGAWHCLGFSFNQASGTKSCSVMMDATYLTANASEYDYQAFTNQSLSIGFQQLVVGSMASQSNTQTQAGQLGETIVLNRTMTRAEFDQYYAMTKAQYGR